MRGPQKEPFEEDSLDEIIVGSFQQKEMKELLVEPLYLLLFEPLQGPLRRSWTLAVGSTRNYRWRS